MESPEDFWRNEMVRQAETPNAGIYDEFGIQMHRRMFLEHHKDSILETIGHPSIQSWFRSIEHDVINDGSGSLDYFKEKVLQRFKACPDKINSIMLQVNSGVPLNLAVEYILEK